METTTKHGAITRASLPGDDQLLSEAANGLGRRRRRILERYALAEMDRMGELSEIARAAVRIALGERDFARLESVELALDRLRDGRWFECEICGGSIRRERLRANPECSVCRDCRTL